MGQAKRDRRGDRWGRMEVGEQGEAERVEATTRAAGVWEELGSSH